VAAGRSLRRIHPGLRRDQVEIMTVWARDQCYMFFSPKHSFSRKSAKIIYLVIHRYAMAVCWRNEKMHWPKYIYF
jgi:hypothetical protein